METQIVTKSDLFDTHGALFSEDRKYRYALLRMWELNKPLVMFIDPTIRRCMKFAFDWDYGGMYMMNLFAWVTPYPEELLKCQDPVGDNDKWLGKAYDKCEEVIFCWGAFKQAKERAEKVMQMFPNAKALVINDDGSPRHPLYVKSTVKPIPFEKGTRNPQPVTQ